MTQPGHNAETVRNPWVAGTTPRTLEPSCAPAVQLVIDLLAELAAQNDGGEA